MKIFPTIRYLAFAVSILLGVTASALAQTPKAKAATFQLGAQVLTIPAPADFEEAASQFEKIKERFTITEAPDNDMLAVHMPHADCEKLRAGEFGPFNFYTKVSIRKSVREEDYTAERFAELVAVFRQSGSQILDVNGPVMKAATERLDKSLTKLNEQETQVDLSQPVNLGEFDTRPNVYSVMLLLNIKTTTGDRETTVPILGGLSYIRVKQRLVYVYTYRRYESKADAAILRVFTTQWINQILAANNTARRGGKRLY
ncbi:MAG: hypothetical protein ACRD9S_04115 [Pyrinomonadaceae bacterium]